MQGFTIEKWSQLRPFLSIEKSCYFLLDGLVVDFLLRVVVLRDVVGFFLVVDLFFGADVFFVGFFDVVFFVFFVSFHPSSLVDVGQVTLV